MWSMGPKEANPEEEERREWAGCRTANQTPAGLATPPTWAEGGEAGAEGWETHEAAEEGAAGPTAVCPTVVAPPAAEERVIAERLSS